ncbi:MAG: hypothetical protein EPO24_15905 [Bacteroidetes bacterium]|nr:MAG: hypothetical protein EPO24_15905 [Bacteroidota bacterium]
MRSDKHYVGIIVTFSHDMIYKQIGYDNFIRQFVTYPNRFSNSFWNHALPNKPKLDVAYCYALWDGEIRYRANIAAFEEAQAKTFRDGRTIYGGAWMLLSAPVIKAPERIEMKGFQGFRYCEELF